MAPDVWDDSAAYENYVGRWSRPIAAEFVGWLGLPQGSAWLDLGCGTGALSRAILARVNPRLVIGCDRSAAYAGFAQAQTADQRAQFVQAELSNLPLPWTPSRRWPHGLVPAEWWPPTSGTTPQGWS